MPDQKAFTRRRVLQSMAVAAGYMLLRPGIALANQSGSDGYTVTNHTDDEIWWKDQAWNSPVVQPGQSFVQPTDHAPQMRIYRHDDQGVDHYLGFVVVAPNGSVVVWGEYHFDVRPRCSNRGQ